MAGTVLERRLTNGPGKSRIHFAEASQTDDAEIRRLLRENAMPGRISLSLEREPNYFSDCHLPAERKQTIVARANGRVICAGSCTIRRRFVNGMPRHVGYLGGLRLDRHTAGRFDVLQRGYEYFRQLQGNAPADFYFTTIASDNDRARRFLERGLPGMPCYEFIGEYVTVLLRTSRQPSVCLQSESNAFVAEQFIPQLEHFNRFYQLAPAWSSSELLPLAQLGLGYPDFRFVFRNGRIVAGAALWDQRVFKQTVIQGFVPWLELIRPLFNIAMRIVERPRLPCMGTTLANAFVSHLVANADDPKSLISLITDLRTVAAQRELEVLTLGFAINDPRLAIVLNNFPHREYHSRIYLVRWPEIGSPAADLDGRTLAPETALL